MNKKNRTKLAIAFGVTTLVLGGLAVVGATGISSEIQERVDRACHREIVKRTPLGRRGLETQDYRIEGENVGVAEGRVQTKATDTLWATVKWTCRIDQKSGQVLQVAFGRSGGGSRFKAAASSF